VRRRSPPTHFHISRQLSTGSAASAITLPATGGRDYPGSGGSSPFFPLGTEEGEGEEEEEEGPRWDFSMQGYVRRRVVCDVCLGAWGHRR
jgi:hypothetical protein